MNEKRTRGNSGLIGIALMLLLPIAACDDNSDNNSGSRKPQADNPVVEGPITGGGGDDCCKLVVVPGELEVDFRDRGYTPGTPFYAGLTFDEAELGYRETEYFISGTAKSYLPTDELTEDGIWHVQAADAADYVSRIVVLRPENDADFNGSVVVEWFNVTGGVDASPDLVYIHTELMREGYAWVGVSAQFVGVEGGGSFEMPLKLADPERYSGLSHPGDSFAYDIFSQAAQAVRHPVGIDPLEGLKVERMIGIGQSQSAGRLTTYINAIHPTIELFDGFVIHSRGDAAAPLSQAPQVEASVPHPTLTRNDLAEPVIGLQAEGDLFLLGSVVARQPDSAFYRLWETAGTAHSDAYTTIKGRFDRGDDPTVADVIATVDASPPLLKCNSPINDGPTHWIARAAIAAIDRWIRTGEAAPEAQRLSLNEDQTDFVRDEFGNATGGIRTPYVDAPVATLTGEKQTGTSYCFLFGTTELFDDARLAMLYPTKQAYIDAIDEATDAAVTAGFLVPVDADLIKSRARTSGLGGP
jgi:hypothetical protein